jgi:hypothetical protein
MNLRNLFGRPDREPVADCKNCKASRDAAELGRAVAMNHKQEVERLSTILRFAQIPDQDLANEGQILSALSLVDENTPLWRALFACMAAHEKIELEGLLAPNLSDAARHYNAGRRAMLEDLRGNLLKKWHESRKSQ